MTKSPILVFDLDGTLIDTATDLVTALNRVLEAERLDPVPLADARNMIGHGARALLMRGFARNRVELPEDRVEELYHRFLAYYESHIADESRPFPGALEALDRFAGEGWRLAICTNKLERYARLLFDELELSDRFAAICGGDTFGIGKPDPRPLIATIEAAGGSIADAVMVGDSASDIDAAKAAGIPVVAVDFGYTQIPVSQLGPDRIISHFDALYTAVAELRRGRLRL